jgi:hypothetical protein
VTISRRGLHLIESQASAESPFAGIFHQEYLGMFSLADQEQYFGRLGGAIGTVDAELKNAIVRLCGGHPYLLEMTGYEAVSIHQQGGRVLPDCLTSRLQMPLLDFYERVRDKVLYEYEKKAAAAYCQEIVQVIAGQQTAFQEQ